MDDFKYKPLRIDISTDQFARPVKIFTTSGKLKIGPVLGNQYTMCHRTST